MEETKTQNQGGTQEVEAEVTPNKAEQTPKTKSGNANAGDEAQAVIKGLQRTIAKKDAEINTLRSELEEMRKKYEDLLAEKEQLSQAAKKAKELEDAVSKYSAEIARKNLIMSDFPDLAPLEAEGLLPDIDDVEKLKESLKKMREYVASTATEKARQLATGVVPDSSKTGGGLEQLSNAELIEAAMDAARRGDERAREQIMSILTQR